MPSLHHICHIAIFLANALHLLLWRYTPKSQHVFGNAWHLILSLLPSRCLGQLPPSLPMLAGDDESWKSNNIRRLLQIRREILVIKSIKTWLGNLKPTILSPLKQNFNSSRVNCTATQLYARWALTCIPSSLGGRQLLLNIFLMKSCVFWTHKVDYKCTVSQVSSNSAQNPDLAAFLISCSQPVACLGI